MTVMTLILTALAVECMFAAMILHNTMVGRTYRAKRLFALIPKRKLTAILIHGFVCALFILLTTSVIACAEEQGPLAAGTRFVFLSPTATFDTRLGSNSSTFDDDFKPDIYFEFYPLKNLAIEYSFMVSEHGFSYGSPYQVIGSTFLLTQSASGKLYLSQGSTISPYVGGGMNIVMPFSTSSSADSFSIDNHVGWMVQGGVDFRMSKNSWFNFDYRFMDMNTQAHINGNSYRFDISPHVYAFGIKYRY